MRGLKIILGIVVVLAAAQVVRPDHANPASDPTHAIQPPPTATGLGAVLDRSCGDCHSNRTSWPWYTQLAPLSWLYGYGVSEGRKVVNFSEWNAYSPERQHALLGASCQDATTGKMSGGAYTLFHPEAKLSAQDVETICTAAR